MAPQTPLGSPRGAPPKALGLLQHVPHDFSFSSPQPRPAVCPKNSPEGLGAGGHVAPSCLSARVARGVGLGRLLALGDEQILRLTMLIGRARNFAPRGRKSVGTLRAGELPGALGPELPQPSRAPSPCLGPTLSPTCGEGLGFVPAESPGSRGLLPCLLQSQQDWTLVSQIRLHAGLAAS